MWMVYLLWIVIVFCGGFMGLGAAWTVYQQGFDLALILNVVFYLGCAIYGAPRLVKLVFRRS